MATRTSWVFGQQANTNDMETRDRRDEKQQMEESLEELSVQGSDHTLVVGSTEIYDEQGRMRCIPVSHRVYGCPCLGTMLANIMF